MLKGGGNKVNPMCCASLRNPAYQSQRTATTSFHGGIDWWRLAGHQPPCCCPAQRNSWKKPPWAAVITSRSRSRRGLLRKWHVRKRAPLGFGKVMIRRTPAMRDGGAGLPWCFVLYWLYFAMLSLASIALGSGFQDANKVATMGKQQTDIPS